MKRKYPKTTGYYVYAHVTPDKLCYFGMSKWQPRYRWRVLQYKNCSLEPYINQYGWDSIEHIIIQDGLTERQAEVIEDWFITKAKGDGFCINKNVSGGRNRNGKKEYQREYNQRTEVKEHHREYQREYNKSHKSKEYHREYMRQYYLKKKQNV